MSENSKLLRSWLDEGDCTGCQSCVIACSFHHNQTFAPSQASLRVFKDNETGDIRINLYASCDMCRGEASPLCVEFCPRDAASKQLMIMINNADN